jgi:LysM repeat protein
MKKALFIIGFLFVFHGLFAQSPSEIRAYINQYKSLALEQERLYGVPAPITLAQGILESGAGKSGLATKANNHFGIKAIGGWPGGIYLAWDDEPTKSKFRVYKSVEESYVDHSKLLKNNGRYQSLFNISIYDYRGWAVGLQNAGYATSKRYAKALIGYIDAYELYKINGGVKLKPGKKALIVVKTTKEEELSDATEYVIDASEKTEEEEEVTHTLQKFVVEINDVRCTILYPGETLSSISMKYDIPKDKILDYNETASEDDIQEGSIVYLERKKRKYYGAQDFYRVKKGDSLYSIAQQFGIRTSRLAKMNDKDLFSPLAEGEKLKLK